MMYCVVLPEAAVYKYFGMYVNSCKEISIRHAEVFRAESWGQSLLVRVCSIHSKTLLCQSLSCFHNHL